jgi:hypothetical protein
MYAIYSQNVYSHEFFLNGVVRMDGWTDGWKAYNHFGMMKNTTGSCMCMCMYLFLDVCEGKFARTLNTIRMFCSLLDILDDVVVRLAL